ncbi:MAG: DUF1801 domain-containing protein [Acidiferrobacterales bacterium]
MAIKIDPKVKAYLEQLPEPQKSICKKVRKTIFQTYPDIEETFENGVPWYECKYYIVGLKDHVNVGFSVEGLSEREKSLFEGKGKYMRHIKLYSPDDVDEEKIVELLKVVK